MFLRLLLAPSSACICCALLMFLAMNPGSFCKPHSLCYGWLPRAGTGIIVLCREREGARKLFKIYKLYCKHTRFRTHILLLNPIATGIVSSSSQQQQLSQSCHPSKSITRCRSLSGMRRRRRNNNNIMPPL